jgi:hypothetical protein
VAQLNEKPVRLLMHDMAASFGLAHDETFSRERAIEWFRAHYPNVKEGTVVAHLIRLSTNVPTRLQYSARADGSDDLLFKIDSSHFRLYRPGQDPTPISVENPKPTESVATETELREAAASSEFAYERDLRDYLARNLGVIESGLTLYEDEGIRGVEFPAGGRFIDILAQDAQGYVVIELKVSRGYDRVVGQLLRYVGWIKQHHADLGQKVRGIIVANEISEDLLLACSGLPVVTLYEYTLSVSVRRVTAGVAG